MIGKTLSHYRVVEKIGAGGMGEVYRAHDQRLERDVALKVLPTGTLADEAARKRFRKEALALAKLNHPHIATVFEFGTQDGVDFLVMELVEGVTLSDKLAGGPLLEKEIARLGMQLAEALEEAHERGVVHRDLKPGNVMVTAKGQAKVLDFGLAKLVRPDVASATATTESFTETQGVAGTLPYMAPEQLRGEPVDARTDIHALGAVLYEMATGQRAFPDRQAAQLTAAILQLPVSSPRALNRRVSVEMERIVLKCLEKEPENRYQSAKEIAVDLRRLGRGTSTTAPAPWQVPRGSARWGWRRVGLVAVALLALVAVLVGSNVAGLRDRLLGGVAPGRITSIAVLPLENLMGDSEQDYFVAGMHEALITELSKIGALTVISRTSAMRYRNTDKSVPEIARELGVDAVVEGSVFRVENTVRITAQLIEAATDRHLWADNFDRELRDILALHSDVARAIARQIRVTLTPKEESRLAAARPVNPEAFEAYLKGRFHWQKQTREDFDIAERYFQSALQKDPNYALAYAGLGMVWIMRGDAGFQAPSETFPKGTAFFAKAIELDDSSAEVRVSLANHKTTTQWDWSGAEKEFKRAIEINPNLADAHFFYADLLLALKRTEEWKREIKRARELDPLNDFKESYYGWHLNYLGRYDEAIPIFQKLLPTGPNKATNYLGLWGAYYKKGMYDEALAAAKSYFAAIGDHEFADALGTEQGEAAYRAGMKRAGEVMAARSKQRHVPAIRIARMFAHAGDKHSAIQWLEKAYQARESPMMRLGVFWDWDDLRDDPRFQDLLRRMNFPE